MKRLLVAVTALSLAALPGSALAKAKPASSAATYGHAGRFITDSRGRVVTFHGLNLVDKLAASGYAPDGAGFGRDDARFLAQNGFNVIRLGIIWKALEPQPGVYDDAYLARVRHTTRILADAGMSADLLEPIGDPAQTIERIAERGEDHVWIHRLSPDEIETDISDSVWRPLPHNSTPDQQDDYCSDNSAD